MPMTSASGSIDRLAQNSADGHCSRGRSSFSLDAAIPTTICPTLAMDRCAQDREPAQYTRAGPGFSRGRTDETRADARALSKYYGAMRGTLAAAFALWMAILA